jgi:hypothetical protein
LQNTASYRSWTTLPYKTEQFLMPRNIAINARCPSRLWPFDSKNNTYKRGMGTKFR